MDIDLATTGCCGEGDSDQQFDPALASCCQQPVAEEGCTGSVATTATFNLGFDCCAGPGADAGVFCDGQCRGSQCATTGCCQCEGCIGDGPVCAAGGPSTIEGLAIGCIVGCFAQVCTDFDSFVNQPAELCSEDGLCLAATTATPAASHGGLLLITALLAGAGFLGLAARRRTGRRLT